MSLLIAIKAFIKAWKEPKKGEEFLQDKKIKLDQQDQSHLRLLSLLQQSGRLIDFLKEDISAFSDDQIGMAVRKIHQDCSKQLEDLVTIRPVMTENEGSTVQIPKGYDPTQLKVVGNIQGDPPYTGKLVHKGWKAHKKSLPASVNNAVPEVIYPAEIEVR
jgi:hypothetical protein